MLDFCHSDVFDLHLSEQKHWLERRDGSLSNTQIACLVTRSSKSARCCWASVADVSDERGLQQMFLSIHKKNETQHKHITTLHKRKKRRSKAGKSGNVDLRCEILRLGVRDRQNSACMQTLRNHVEPVAVFFFVLALLTRQRRLSLWYFSTSCKVLHQFGVGILKI